MTSFATPASGWKARPILDFRLRVDYTPNWLDSHICPKRGVGTKQTIWVLTVKASRRPSSTQFPCFPLGTPKTRHPHWRQHHWVPEKGLEVDQGTEFHMPLGGLKGKPR